MCVNLRLRWSLKQSCSHWDLSNSMWHATCMQRNQDDSRLLMVESQIDNFIYGLSFGHNLCFKYPNGSCEPILKIYVSRSFHWYKELFNPMSFSPCNYLLKIWKSIRTQTSKAGVHLGVWGFNASHYFTFSGAWNVTVGLHSWPAPLQALALVISPKLELRQMDFIHMNVRS